MPPSTSESQHIPEPAFCLFFPPTWEHGTRGLEASSAVFPVCNQGAELEMEQLGHKLLSVGDSSNAGEFRPQCHGPGRPAADPYELCQVHQISPWGPLTAAKGQYVHSCVQL